MNECFEMLKRIDIYFLNAWPHMHAARHFDPVIHISRQQSNSIPTMAIAQPTRRSRRGEKHTFAAGDKVEVSENFVHASFEN